MAKKIIVRFRVSEAEMSAIISNANAHRLPVSSHIRSLVLMAIDKDNKSMEVAKR